MTTARLEGMRDRARNHNVNPFHSEEDRREWNEGWQTMNTAINQVLGNAEGMLKELADLRERRRKAQTPQLATTV